MHRKRRPAMLCPKHKTEMVCYAVKQSKEVFHCLSCIEAAKAKCDLERHRGSHKGRATIGA